MKRIFGLILVAAISMTTLSSCLLLDGDGYSIIGDGGKDINVDGGDNYENININTSAEANALAASKALLSSVSVYASFGSISKVSVGSGVIYKLDKENGDAYIITNYHVVYDSALKANNGISSNVVVYLYGSEPSSYSVNSYPIEATYLGGSMYYDIAVLKVVGSEVLMASDARAVDVANSDEVAVLDTAIAIGNAKDDGISATVGAVNVDSEEIPIPSNFIPAESTQNLTFRVIRTDAAVNEGNSGGGLFNSKGELIGIVNAKITADGTDNIGYAIPSNVAVAIAENAMHYRDGSVYRCMLGVNIRILDHGSKFDTESGKVYKYETVIIVEVVEGSGSVGYLEVGDIINSITVDGKAQKVTRMHHVIEAMLYARVESHVKINVTRGDKTMDIELPITRSMLTEWRTIG